MCGAAPGIAAGAATGEAPGRRARQRRWKLSQILRAALVGLGAVSEILSEKRNRRGTCPGDAVRARATAASRMPAQEVKSAVR